MILKLSKNAQPGWNSRKEPESALRCVDLLSVLSLDRSRIIDPEKGGSEPKATTGPSLICLHEPGHGTMFRGILSSVRCVSICLTSSLFSSGMM